MSLDGFVTTSSRRDELEPAPARGSVGRLPGGARPASLPREKGGLSKYVSQYGTWGRKEKNAGTEQFRYLVRTMHGIEQSLISPARRR